MMAKITHLFRLLLTLALGIALGLISLEVILNLNPTLLLSGMSVPAPVNPAVQRQEYAVRYSDGDLFYWHPGLIHPIPPEGDDLEAQVVYYSDEFGFPNQPPLPSQVDIVVLGRSFSMGAQASRPWPVVLDQSSSWSVLNLSQTGSHMSTKRDYLNRFGFPRHPRWIIIEVLPAGDILDYHPVPSTLVGSLPFPLVMSFVDRAGLRRNAKSDQAPVFPLELSLTGQSYSFAEFIPYLSTLTLDNAAIESSKNWTGYLGDLTALVEDARNQNACLILLYVPSKAEIYLPLAQSLPELDPVLDYIQPYQLDQEGWIVQHSDSQTQAGALQANAEQRPELVKDLAAQLNLVWINPAPALSQAAQSGLSPYMSYDTHWSSLGHQIIADEVRRVIQDNPCP
jgi:hypothetical protein